MALNLNLQTAEGAAENDVSLYVATIEKALAALLPAVQKIDVTLAALNDCLLTPDYSMSFDLTEMAEPENDPFCFHLRVPEPSGLQFADGTLLLVDESRLESGKLDTTGFANHQALSAIAFKQVLLANVGYELELPVDVPVLAISRGSRSILKLPMIYELFVPKLLQIKELTAKLERSPAWLASAHGYLSSCTASVAMLAESVAKMAESEFPTRSSTGFADQLPAALAFHFELTLARLIAASHGEPLVSESHLRKAQSMEAARRPLQ